MIPERLNNSKRADLALLFHSIFSLEIFIAPVMVLFYMKYVGLSFYEMSTFFSIILIFNWALEIPTGIWSDAVGRKSSLLLGKLIYLLAMLLLLVANNWTALLLIAFLMALGSALSSGNLHAICFEMYSSENNQKEFHRHLSIGNSISLAVSAVGAVLGGYLAGVDFSLVIYLDALMLFFSMITAWVLLPDSNVVTRRDKSVKYADGFSQLLSILREGGKLVAASPSLIYMILMSALCFSILRTGANLYQPIMEKNHIDIENFGWWFASFNIIAAVSAYLGSRIKDRHINLMAIPVISLAFMIISAVSIYSELGLLTVLVAVGGHQIVRGQLPPFLSYCTNKLIPVFHQSRTSILSFSSFVKAFAAAATMISVGYMDSILSVENIFSFLSILFVVGITSILFLEKASFKKTIDIENV